MPKSKNINIRATEEEIERLKAGASKLKISMTALMMRSSLHVANRATTEQSNVVSTSSQSLQEASGKLVNAPAQQQSVPTPPGVVTPSTPIGDLTEQQILDWLRDLRAHREEVEEARRLRQAYADQDS